MADPTNAVAYCSSQAHSSVIKAAMIAGLGRENVRLIDVDASLAMDPKALDRAITLDRQAGRRPFFVCATVGTTSSGAVDPLAAVGRVASRENLWMHVDAAYAGAACVCPEHRGIINGVEFADSFNFNPHKWLLTTFDCSAFWVADQNALLKALSITPEYLRNAASESGAVIDYRDWQIPLGRRFRRKLWFVIRHYGIEGLHSHIRRCVGMAQQFERLVRADDRFELAAARSLSLICFRLVGSDAVNQKLLDRINASGRALLTHTRLPDPARPGSDRMVLPMAIGGVKTLPEQIDHVWDLIRDCTDEIAGDSRLSEDFESR